MRPILRPGLSWAWRSPSSIQIGVDDPDPVVLTGLPASSAVAIDLMDGTRTTADILGALAHRGPTEAVADMIGHLVEMGVVVDGGCWPGGSCVSPEARARLLPELMAHGPRDPEDWWNALASTHVVVVGASRLGGIIARALAAGGVGRVSIDDNRPVTSADLAVGGFAQNDVGRRRSDLLTSRVDATAMRSTVRPTRCLHVITDAVDVERRSRSLMVQGLPFLMTSCRERTGRVGPLVTPGTTACHFCVQLHRRDHDPGWPEVWRQTTWSPSPVALSTSVAVTAQIVAAHVVSWCSGESPPSARGVVEVDPRFGATRFHRTPPHPECGCAWTNRPAV